MAHSRKGTSPRRTRQGEPLAGRQGCPPREGIQKKPQEKAGLTNSNCIGGSRPGMSGIIDLKSHTCEAGASVPAEVSRGPSRWNRPHGRPEREFQDRKHSLRRPRRDSAVWLRSPIPCWRGADGIRKSTVMVSGDPWESATNDRGPWVECQGKAHEPCLPEKFP